MPGVTLLAMTLDVMQRKKTGLIFLTGLAMGLAVYHGVLAVTDRTTIGRSLLAEQQSELDLLRRENQELTDDLFRPPGVNEIDFSPHALPYDAEADAAVMIAAARSGAVAEKKFLMVSFGANWCLDCRTLHHRLNSEPVASYAADHFHFINVDVGKFNRNRDVAESLGVSLTRGIPVAIFFNPRGEIIGTTNDGQLEPSRHYSSEQILKFVRDIAEHNRIRAPDSVE